MRSAKRPAATARESPVLHTRLRRVPHQACSITARPQLLVADGAQQLLGLGRAQAALGPAAFRVPPPDGPLPPPPLGGVLSWLPPRCRTASSRSTSPHGRAAAAAGLRVGALGVGQMPSRPALSSSACAARAAEVVQRAEPDVGIERLRRRARGSPGRPRIESASAAVPALYTRRPLSVGGEPPSGTPRAPGGGHDGPTPSPRAPGEPGLAVPRPRRSVAAHAKAIPNEQRRCVVRRPARPAPSRRASAAIQARGRLCSCASHSRAPADTRPRGHAQRRPGPGGRRRRSVPCAASAAAPSTSSPSRGLDDTTVFSFW